MTRMRTRIPQFFVPYNAKIADISHADILKHTLDLSVALPETRKIIAVIVGAQRMAGTGNFYVYPNEGVTGMWCRHDQFYPFTIISNGTQRLQYAQTVAGDDWDLYCVGYVVEA